MVTVAVGIKHIGLMNDKCQIMQYVEVIQSQRRSFTYRCLAKRVRERVENSHTKLKIDFNARNFNYRIGMETH